MLASLLLVLLGLTGCLGRQERSVFEPWVPPGIGDAPLDQAEPPQTSRAIETVWFRHGLKARRRLFDPWTFSGTPLDPDVLVHLEHTCPSYDVTLYADGLVEYDGHKGVRIRGPRTKRLPPDVIERIRAVLASFHGSSTEGHRRAMISCLGWTDTPTCQYARKLVYRSDAKVHVIEQSEAYNWGDRELRHRELQLLRLMKVVRWTGGDPLGDAVAPRIEAFTTDEIQQHDPGSFFQ